MTKRRNEEDYAKTQILDQSQAQHGHDDASYEEHVDTVESEPDEDQTVRHHWRGPPKR